MEGELNVIGTFAKENNTFRWGWDMLQFNKQKEYSINASFLLQQIIIYILNLHIDPKNPEELLHYLDLKNVFLNPTFEIKNSIQFEFLLAITLYITKSELIYKDTIYNYDVYYLLRNIKLYPSNEKINTIKEN
jgi:hypothetical protein